MMTMGNILFAFCVVCVVLGTIGLVKDLKVKSRQRQQEKHYAAHCDDVADNG